MRRRSTVKSTGKLFQVMIRPALLLQGALLLFASHAEADFYRYIGKDGVEVYTNIPTSDDAVRVLREQEDRSKAETKKERKAASKSQPRKVAQEQLADVVSEPQFSAQEPLLPVTGVVTSRVGWRHDPIDGGIRHHNGVDIAIPAGTGVKAVAAGRVMESGWHGGYGNLVTIDHGDGTISMYGHNSQLAVRAGDMVEAGQTIALSGSTGRSTGPHLHFELWRKGTNVTEAYLTKATALPELARSVKSYLDSNGSAVFTNRY